MTKLLSIWFIELIVNVYDTVTWPIYYLIQQPWKVRQAATKCRTLKIDEHTWANSEGLTNKGNKKNVDTLDQIFRESVANYANKNCLGVRKIIAIEYRDSTDDGSPPQTQQVVTKRRVPSKYVLDDNYTWYTYNQIEQIVIGLSGGLVDICKDSLWNSDGSRKVLICADTCMQWFLMAQACFRNSIIVVTAYTSLDDDAILNSIHQTEVKTLVVSQKIGHRIPKFVEKSPLIDTIIVLDEPLPGEQDERVKLKNLIGNTNVKRVLSYNDILSRGQEVQEAIIAAPKGKDLAVLMYTSGSTGKAKGVMLAHENIVYTAMLFSGPGDITHEDRYLGYLPLGHVLELAAECIFLRNGCTIAYSSPLTLTSNSPMVKKGQFGDAYIFRPTILGAVPLVLDRIRSGVQQAVKSQGTFYDQLINKFVVNYKRYWWERYYDTPIMNRLICKKFNMILGGQIRAICSGGAALSRETQEYLRHVCNYTVLQGYGLTETSAAATFSDIHDRRYNVVGPPYPIVHIKLESWSDYSVNDKPHPRGEIIVGGQPVSSGYYKMDELTRESFYVHPKTGMRFFRTGDIGMMLPDGSLKIIDRKKDIVKPLSGEYISLSEIETALGTMPIIENICVYCSQYSNYVIALVRPFPKELRFLAKQLFNETSESANKFRESISKEYDEIAARRNNTSILDKIRFETLCSNKYLVQKLVSLFEAEGNKRKLKRTQIPKNLKLISEEWSPESGLVTASFKLRRREIERHYAEDIKKLYRELGQNIEQNS